MISLVLQVRVVFAAEPETRTIFTILGAIAVTVLTGMVTAWVIINIRYVFLESTALPFWLYTAYKIIFCSFVGIGCFIRLSKLGFRIYRRPKMGMNINQFGPLQIIFVMFCQCLTVPRNYTTSDPKLTMCFSHVLYPRSPCHRIEFCQLR